MKRWVVLVGVGLGLAGCAGQASTRYQIVGAGQGAYRLDTHTGEVRFYTPRGFLPVGTELPAQKTPEQQADEDFKALQEGHIP